MTRWATLALTAAGAALPALAHHSTSMYDRNTPITIEAEVVEFRWVNPHSYLTVVEHGRGVARSTQDLVHRDVEPRRADAKRLDRSARSTPATRSR